MSMTETDESILEAVQRWHIFNRDPSNEHWQNIDTLLHKIKTTPEEIQEAVKDEKAYWERETGVLEQQLKDKDALIDELNGDIERFEIDLHNELERCAAISKAADELDNARVDHALKVEAELTDLRDRFKRAGEVAHDLNTQALVRHQELEKANRKNRALTAFAEMCARERDGEEGVTKIRKVLARIDSGEFKPGE